MLQCSYGLCVCSKSEIQQKQHASLAFYCHWIALVRIESASWQQVWDQANGKAFRSLRFYFAQTYRLSEPRIQKVCFFFFHAHNLTLSFRWMKKYP